MRQPLRIAQVYWSGTADRSTQMSQSAARSPASALVLRLTGVRGMNRFFHAPSHSHHWPAVQNGRI